jgi:hypothetical protein
MSSKISPAINRLLVCEMFAPEHRAIPGHPDTFLVLANEMGARLRTESGHLSDGGRLVQNVATGLGVHACGFLRLGTEGNHSWRDKMTIYRALSSENYHETIADIGKVLRSRITAYMRSQNLRAGIVLDGKSGGGIYSAALANVNTIGAECAVTLEPAGIRDMKTTMRAARAMYRYKHEVESTIEKPPRLPAEAANAEPASVARTLADMFYNGRIASSSQTLEDIEAAEIPTYLELAEYGMYCQITDLAGLVEDINDTYPATTAYLLPGASHDHYNGSPEHAQAVERGLQALYYWPS